MAIKKISRKKKCTKPARNKIDINKPTPISATQTMEGNTHGWIWCVEKKFRARTMGVENAMKEKSYYNKFTEPSMFYFVLLSRM